MRLFFGLFLECPIPFAIIFGGTDLNEHCKDEEKFETMSKVVGEARYIIYCCIIRVSIIVIKYTRACHHAHLR